MNIRASRHGFTLVEVVITASVFLIVILGLVGTHAYAVRTSLENVNKIEASFLEEEGLEALRLMRDVSWSLNILPQSPGANFYIAFDGTNWATTSANILINGMFERKLVLNSVYRDASSNIVSSGGTLDPDTRKVTATVAWFSGGATTTKSLSTYITNIFAN